MAMTEDRWAGLREWALIRQKWDVLDLLAERDALLAERDSLARELEQYSPRSNRVNQP